MLHLKEEETFEIIANKKEKKFGFRLMARHLIFLRGESKFEIRTLSVNPTLRGWGVNPLTLRIAIVIFCRKSVMQD